MTVWNLGSINIDNFYRVSHLPRPGETIAASEYSCGLGGKGANMSVAAARAAARVAHIGAIGPDGGWTVERMLEYGVDIRHILRLDAPTGHANIAIDAAGENQIILYAGANREIPETHVSACLAMADAADVLLLQNETNGQATAARLGRTLGLRVIYAAAPFDAASVQAVLPHLDMLVLNEVEAGQLTDALGVGLTDLVVRDVIVTRGSEGVVWHGSEGSLSLPAPKVRAVDTTGAGDTFTGYLAAGLDRGLPMRQSLSLAIRAAAVMVTRVGTADVIPDLKDLDDARLG